jgi:ubiquinone/menaquinone biosynthesis C-methylase UbiE
MRACRDPEGAELDQIVNACPLEGKKVLEIGCGHGQLTYQYAQTAQKTCAIDPDLSELKDAFQSNQSTNAYFIQAKAEQLPFPSLLFDVVILASSL